MSANVLTRGITTKFPLVCVLMEMSAQLEQKRARLDLDWVPRELNQEADDLSNLRLDGFSPDLCMASRPSDIRFLVLDGLVAEAAKFYSMASKRSAATSLPYPRQPEARRMKLREREPW